MRDGAHNERLQRQEQEFGESDVETVGEIFGRKVREICGAVEVVHAVASFGRCLSCFVVIIVIALVGARTVRDLVQRFGRCCAGKRSFSNLVLRPRSSRW